MNQAIHTLDVLCWLAGGVESTKAKTFTLARDIEVEDTAFALFKFKNNAFGVFEAATLYNPGIGVKVEIQCEYGRIEFDGSKAILINPDQNGNAVELCLNEEPGTKEGVANNPAALGLEGHTFFIADMADAIMNGKQPYIPADMGRYAVDVILSIYKSSCENKEITV